MFQTSSRAPRAAGVVLFLLSLAVAACGPKTRTSAPVEILPPGETAAAVSTQSSSSVSYNDDNTGTQGNAAFSDLSGH